MDCDTTMFWHVDKWTGYTFSGESGMQIMKAKLPEI